MNSRLEHFIEENWDYILADLSDVVLYCKSIMVENPDNLSNDDGSQSIDVRLCIDIHPDKNFAIRTGDVSYDQRHSDYCAASSIGPDTDPKELLKELVKQFE